MSTPRKVRFAITSDYGRIGPFWWYNSDTQIRERRGPGYCTTFSRWGSFTLGGSTVVHSHVVARPQP
jgi:hypothetical protein